MRLKIETKVQGNQKEVFEKFTKELLLFVSMPYPRFKLIHFNGSSVGSVVEAELDMIIKKVKWVSVVTEHEVQSEKSWFVDEGTVMPFGMIYWRHKHLVEQRNDGAYIIDDLTFHGNNFFKSLMLYFMFIPAFYYRKPRYKMYFKKLP